MRFFAKSVTNSDVCFVHDVAELLCVLSEYTTDTAWGNITRKVLTERGLIDIFDEHAPNLAGYIVKDCYPTDRNELMNHAEALFEIGTKTLNWQHQPAFVGKLLRLVSKMGLYDSEKKMLIVKYLFNGQPILDDMIEELVHLY